MKEVKIDLRHQQKWHYESSDLMIEIQVIFCFSLYYQLISIEAISPREVIFPQERSITICKKTQLLQ